MTDKLSTFFEWCKLGQRIVMVFLTIGLLLVLRTASYEIQDLKTEIKNVAEISERALVTANEIRIEINQQIDEIQKYGVKLNVKFW